MCAVVVITGNNIHLSLNVVLVTARETEIHEVATQFKFLCLCFGGFNAEELSQVWIPTLKKVLVPLLSRLNFYKFGCFLTGQICLSTGFTTNNV